MAWAILSKESKSLKVSGRLAPDVTESQKIEIPHIIAGI